MTGDVTLLLETAESIAREAGALVAERFRKGQRVATKGHAHNLVTDTDEAAEALIVGGLTAAFPDHVVIGEEAATASEGRGVGGATRAGSTVTWYVDPLDGTNNFAHGFPIFCVSMAATRGPEVLCGVTFDPLRDEMFTAGLGRGAAVNGTPLAVSRRSLLEASLVATGFPYDKATNPDNNLVEFVHVAPRVRGVRRPGSAALDLAYVASGRLEAYWEHGTRPWDVAAGVLMVREAGGRVTDLAGGHPSLDGGRFVASNGLVHEELVQLLSTARSELEATASRPHDDTPR